LTNQRTPVLLIFGYPLNAGYLGGLVWIKKVVEYIERIKAFKVTKVSNDRDLNVRSLANLFHVHALLKGLITNPNIAVLDTYGEAAIRMWILLRLFKPSIKIVTVFRHYEPLSVRYKTGGVLRMKYCTLIDWFTKLMLKNSDKILTVSNASMSQLQEIVKVKDTNKIVVVGCASSDNLSTYSNGIRDIDFLCVGRFEKFCRIENIWTIIKRKSPTSKFVMVGRASSGDLSYMRKIGIDHMGIVSEDKKKQLYGRTKVFIFPSMYEGFGMAITEAISARLHIVAWKLPVFEERFRLQSMTNVELVQIGNYEFAQKAIAAVKDSEKLVRPSPMPHQNSNLIKTWGEVGCIVSSVLVKLF